MLSIGQISQHFWRSEFACKCGCGFDTVDAELIFVLERLRFELGNHTVTITSGCRCQDHNKKIGGSPKSQHLYGKAVDFKVKSVRDSVVSDTINKLYPQRYGMGKYTGRTHIDVRSTPGGSRWDLRKE